jgi:FecR protein
MMGLWLVMQFIISAHAGLVNYVDGQATVRVHDQVAAGIPIETSAGSRVEILLNPGSFLRLDQNTRVVLDSVDLTNVAVHVLSGNAIVETASVDRHSPISVVTGKLHTKIVAPGLYRFSGDTAGVLDGKLQVADSSQSVKKGKEVTAIGSDYQQSPLVSGVAFDALDQWSAQRSSVLARANTLAYYRQTTGSYFPFGWSASSLGYIGAGSGWIYSPFLNGYTFIPQQSYMSYYGYSFVPAPVFLQQTNRPAPGSIQSLRSRPTTGATEHVASKLVTASSTNSTASRPVESRPVATSMSTSASSSRASAPVARSSSRP